MRAVFDTLGFLIGADCCISKYVRNDTSVQYQCLWKARYGFDKPT